MTRFVVAFSIAILITVPGAYTQNLAGSPQRPGTVVRLSSLPFWPQNGIIPPELANQYVFMEPKTGDLIVSYPADLGTPDVDLTRSPRVTFHVGLPH